MRLRSHGRRASLAALALVVSILVGGRAAAQPETPPSISGRLLHAQTGAPVAGALVFVEEVARDVRTARDGTFAVAGLGPGVYHLVISATGFVPLRIEVSVDAATRAAAPREILLSPELHYSEVVSVSPTSRDPFESYQSTSVLAGHELSERLGGTLASTLTTQPGIAQRSLGPAAARPVIRGFDGDRVVVLENGQRMGDVSSQSGDHGVNVNPAAASRIEVVRGPATLLYGSNALGGLINVISDQIPPTPVTQTTGTIQVDAGSAHREGGAAADLAIGDGNWALRVGGAGRGTGDVRTPDGVVDNTQARSGLGSIGVSRTWAQAFLGASYQYDDFRYGVPVVHEGLVELTPRRHAASARGEIRDLGGFFAAVRGGAAYRSYRHDEVEAGEIGTRFENDAVELDLRADHRPIGRLSGTVGAWGLSRRFEAVGEEALSPAVDQAGLALFSYQELTWPHVTLQFGGRYERTRYEPEEGLTPRTFDNFSGSLGVLLRPNDATTVAVNLARAVRSPALEELYFFGPHTGNLSFEVGNPDLKAERGLGLDVSFRWRLPRTSGAVTYFRNDIADYVFRRPLSEEEFDARFGHDAHADEHGHGDELPSVEFTGADSVLQGFELHGDVQVAGPLTAELTLDLVRGTLKDAGTALPRIPPARAILGLRYQGGLVHAGAELIAVAKQNRLFDAETPTAGYGLLKMYVSRSFAQGRVLHTITARLDNATDTRYRNHLSYVKDFVLEPGRDFRVVYSVRF